MSRRQLYEVEMRSRPGPYAQYDGTVKVWFAADPDSEFTEEHQMFMAAVRELQRTSFPDRSAVMWGMVSYRKIPS